MLTRFLMPALLLAGGVCVFSQSAKPVDGAAVEEAYNLSLVVKKMEAHVAAGDLQGALKYNYISVKAFQFLLARPELALPDKQSKVRPALLQFSRALTGVRNASLNGDQAEAQEAVKELHNAWTAVIELYPVEFLNAISQLSIRVFCPKHGEVIAAEGDRCPKCGRSLQRVDEFCGLPSTDPIIRASALPMEPLKTGRKADVILKLTRKDGLPVRETDLLRTHLERMHVFAIDPTLSDYHHVHPASGSSPGEYTFSFIPQTAGGYRVWIDLLPIATRRDEMPSFDLGHFEPGTLDHGAAEIVTNGSWRLKFTIDTPPLRAGTGGGWARLTVTDLDGIPCTRLEPIMANFAHFVGFHEDRQTVYHLHAAGMRDIVDPSLRSGPEVQLYLPTLKAGFIRLFAQIQIGGRILTAPFGIFVEP